MDNSFREAIDAYNCGDTSAAIEKMELCARRNEPRACFIMALWLDTGEGLKKSKRRSKYWLSRLEQLAEDDNPDAQWELGQNHRFGNLVELDIERANYWLERAAKAGHGDAQHHLAWYYETGQHGYPVDTGLAEEWYGRALTSGNPETLYMFAMRVFTGGQPSDEVVRLMQEAAAKNFLPAIEFLRTTQN